MRIANKVVFFVATFSAIVAASLPTPSHAAGYGGNQYNGSEMRQMQQVIVAEVADIRDVSVDTQTWQSQTAATSVGGAFGGLVGSRYGNGAGRIAAAALGAIAGGYVGNKIDQRLSTRSALEFVLKLSDGRYVAVTQEADAQSAGVHVGDTVRLLSVNGTVRLAPMGRRI